MTSHIHMIIGSNKDKLENIMRDMKRYTSERLKEAIKFHPTESRKEWMVWMMQRAGLKNGNNKDWQLWQQHNQPLEIATIEMFHRTSNYIHYNPVEAGFVELEEEYLYSSARDFHGKKGLIELSYVT